MMNTSCFKNHPFSNKLLRFSLNEDTIEISTVECLSICQFKIGQGGIHEKKMDCSLPFLPVLHTREKKDTARG